MHSKQHTSTPCHISNLVSCLIGLPIIDLRHAENLEREYDPRFPHCGLIIPQTSRRLSQTHSRSEYT